MSLNQYVIVLIVSLVLVIVVAVIVWFAAPQIVHINGLKQQEKKYKHNAQFSWLVEVEFYSRRNMTRAGASLRDRNIQLLSSL